MTPTARQIAHSPLLPVRTLNIGTIDRLSGNSAWAQAIIERYKPAGESDLPSVDFVYQEEAAQEAAETISELNTLITTINNIRYNVNILNQSYMNRYYVSVQERCELMLGSLGNNIFSADAAQIYKEVYREVLKPEYVPADEETFKTKMLQTAQKAGIPGVSRAAASGAAAPYSGSKEYKLNHAGAAGRRAGGRQGEHPNGMNTLYDDADRVYRQDSEETEGHASGRMSLTHGISMNGRMPLTQRMPMIRDMRFVSEWTSQSAKQFFWRVQRAGEVEREIILQGAGAGSLISLEKRLRTMSDAGFRLFVDEISRQVRSRIEDIASQAVQEERLKTSGIVGGRSVSSLTGTGHESADARRSRNETESVEVRQARIDVESAGTRQMRTGIESVGTPSARTEDESEVGTQAEENSSGMPEHGADVDRSASESDKNRENISDEDSGSSTLGIGAADGDSNGSSIYSDMRRPESGKSDAGDDAAVESLPAGGTLPAAILEAITGADKAEAEAEEYPGRDAILAYLKVDTDTKDEPVSDHVHRETGRDISEGGGHDIHHEDTYGDVIRDGDARRDDIQSREKGNEDISYGNVSREENHIVSEYVTEALRSLHIFEDNRAITDSIAQNILDMPRSRWDEFKNGLSRIREEYPATEKLLTSYFDKVERTYERYGLRVSQENSTGDVPEMADAEMSHRAAGGETVPGAEMTAELTHRVAGSEPVVGADMTAELTHHVTGSEPVVGADMTAELTHRVTGSEPVVGADMTAELTHHVTGSESVVGADMTAELTHRIAGNEAALGAEAAAEFGHIPQDGKAAPGMEITAEPGNIMSTGESSPGTGKTAEMPLRAAGNDEISGAEPIPHVPGDGEKNQAPANETMLGNMRMSAEKMAFLEFLQEIHTDGIRNMLITERQILQSGFLGDDDTGEELSELDRLEAMPELTYRNDAAARELENMGPEEWDMFTDILTAVDNRLRTGGEVGIQADIRAGGAAGKQADVRTNSAVNDDAVDQLPGRTGYHDFALGGGESRQGGTISEDRANNSSQSEDIVKKQQPVAESIAQSVLDMSSSEWDAFRDVLSGIREEDPETDDILRVYFDEVHRIHVSRDAGESTEMTAGHVGTTGMDALKDTEAKHSGSEYAGSERHGSASVTSEPYYAASGSAISGSDHTGSGTARSEHDINRESIEKTSDDARERNIIMSAEKLAFIRLLTNVSTENIAAVLNVEHRILLSGAMGDEDVSEELSLIEALRSQPELVYRTGADSRNMPDADQMDLVRSLISQDGFNWENVQRGNSVWNAVPNSGLSDVQASRSAVTGGARDAGYIDDVFTEIAQDMRAQMDVRRYVYAGERNIYHSPYSRFILEETASRGRAASGSGAGGRSGMSGTAGSNRGTAPAAGSSMGIFAGRTASEMRPGTGSADSEYLEGTLGIAQAALEMLRSSRIGVAEASLTSAQADSDSPGTPGLSRTDMIRAGATRYGRGGLARSSYGQTEGLPREVEAARLRTKDQDDFAADLVAEPDYEDYGIADIVINAPARARGDNDADTINRSRETVRRTQETAKDIEIVTRTQTSHEHVIHEAQEDLRSAMEKLDKHQTEIERLKTSEKEFARFTDQMTKASIRGDIMRDISSRLRMERLRNGL